MTNFQKDKGIMSLAVVFVVGLFGLSTALTITTVALVGLNKNMDNKSGNQSFYTAEAAVREGIYQCINDPFLCDDDESASYSGGALQPNQLLNGTLMGNIEVIDNWPFIEVTGDAGNNLTYRKIITNVFPGGLEVIFNCAVFSNNNLDFGGSVDVNGNVFANGEMDFTGASAQVNGDVASPLPVEDEDNITGDIFVGIDSIDPPIIDLQPYYDEAVDEGTFFDNSTDAETYLSSGPIPGPEVVYVEDLINETHITGANLTGSLVVEGDLQMSGGTIINAANNYAAVIVEGNLTITGNTTINGVVYVTGDTSFSGGNVEINGSLIAIGNVTDLTGSVTVNFDENTIGDWQTFFGLETTSSEPPSVVSWNEQ